MERNDDTERGSNPGESSLTDNPNGIEPHFLEGNKTNFSHLRAVATAEQVKAILLPPTPYTDTAQSLRGLNLQVLQTC